MPKIVVMAIGDNLHIILVIVTVILCMSLLDHTGPCHTPKHAISSEKKSFFRVGAMPVPDPFLGGEGTCPSPILSSPPILWNSPLVLPEFQADLRHRCRHRE